MAWPLVEKTTFLFYYYFMLFLSLAPKMMLNFASAAGICILNILKLYRMDSTSIFKNFFISKLSGEPLAFRGKEIGKLA